MSASSRTLGRDALEPASPGTIDSAIPPRAFPIVVALLLRGIVNGGFAFWLLAMAPAWIDVFRGGAVYALADGALGIVTAILLKRYTSISVPPLLLSITLCDAVLRVCAGVAILAFPGIPYLPITVVLFFGTLGAWAGTAGLIAMAAWFIAHRAERNAERRSPVHALFDPLGAWGLIALMLAVYALVIGPPATDQELRVAAATASGCLGVAFIVAAFGVAARRTRLSTR